MITYHNLCNSGRFGNHLFHIAALIGISKKNDDNYVLPDCWKYFFLFENNFNSMNFNDIADQTTITYSVSDFFYRDINYSNKDFLNLEGQYQSEKYFIHAEKEVRKAFTFKKKFRKKIHENEICAIHFRHGDCYDRRRGAGHVGIEDRFPVMTPTYYKNCVEYMLSKGVKKFHIFYDDIRTKRWIFKNIDVLKKVDHTYVDFNNNFWDDFSMMSSCDYNITANSTFSWWAAWLNNNENKIVCCPTKEEWLGPSFAHWDRKDLIPSSWVQQKQS
jgi:hypothetical protein